MRRVAAELDVQPSALYHHVPNKQSLLALMADDIVSVVVGDDPRTLCHSLRDAMLSVRDGAEVVATASAFRLGDSAVQQRLAAMVGDDGASTLLHYVFGQTASTQTHRLASSVGAIEEDLDLDRAFDRGLDIILAGLAALDA